MKKYCSLFLYILLLTIIVVRCKKESKEPLKDIPQVDVESNIKKWLKSQADTIKANKILYSANWKNSFFLKGDSNDVYYITEINTTGTTNFSDKKLRRFFILQQDESKSTKGFIYEVLGRSTEIDSHQSELIAGYANINLNFPFEGELSKFSWTGTFLESTQYTNGKLKSYTKLYEKAVNSKVSIQSLAKEKNSLQCSDWFVILYYTDGTATVTYLGRTCTCGDQNYSYDSKGTFSIKLNCATGGGGGSTGDGGDGPGCIHQTTAIRNGKMVFEAGDPCTVVPPKVKFNMCNSFSQQEISDFQDTYNYLAEGNCLSKALVAKLEGKTISVCKAAQSSNAYSQPGIIVWNQDLQFYAGTLQEELFHNVQFDYYGASPPRANAEFEAIVYRDIANNGQDGTNNLSNSDANKYVEFLNKITNNHTTYPKTMADIMLNTQAENDYFNAMQAYSNAHGFGQADRSLKPIVLLEVTNLSPCN